MIVTLLLAGASAIGAVEAWSFVKRKWPTRAQQVRSEVSTVEKEAHVISDAFQAQLTRLGAAISSWKSQAEAAQTALANAPKQADLDAANAHIADLTSQLAAANQQIAAASQNTADELSAVQALADQAQPAS